MSVAFSSQKIHLNFIGLNEFQMGGGFSAQVQKNASGTSEFQLCHASHHAYRQLFSFFNYSGGIDALQYST